MRQFVKIILQQSNGQWSAWFEDVPHAILSDEMPSVAISRLIDRFGTNEFDQTSIVKIETATTDTHLEYLIPLVNLRKIPNPSVN